MINFFAEFWMCWQSFTFSVCCNCLSVQNSRISLWGSRHQRCTAPMTSFTWLGELFCWTSSYFRQRCFTLIPITRSLSGNTFHLKVPVLIAAILQLFFINSRILELIISDFARNQGLRRLHFFSSIIRKCLTILGECCLKNITKTRCLRVFTAHCYINNYSHSTNTITRPLQQ